MKIESEKKDSIMFVHIGGRMDAVTAPEFETVCKKFAEEGSVDIVVNFSGLEYISSAGLRSILASAKILKNVGGKLRFYGVSGMVEEVFRISGFQSMFTIAPTLEDVMGC